MFRTQRKLGKVLIMRGVGILVALVGMLMINSSEVAHARKLEKRDPSRIPSGIVEGFYGRPWSHEDRLSMIRFLGENGFQHYCYAPKDDPYHRGKWREPYPPAEFAKLRELIRACQKVRVTFVFAISPGLDIEYGSSQDFEILLTKLRLVYDAGVRAFALFLDDVPSRFPHAEDARRYPSFASAHADLANRLLASLKEWDKSNSLVLCPTEYYHADNTPYLRDLAQMLHRDIPIVWTGMGVTSRDITPDDLLRIRAVTGRKPFLWDNYPVNDYDHGHLYLGPIRGRTPVMPLNLSGYWANPMNEPEASKIALITIADYFRSPDTYDPEESWRRAVLSVGGRQAYPYFRTFADLLSSSFLTADESRVLATLAADYLNSPTPANLASLNYYLDDLAKLDEQLATALANKRLYRDLKPSLKKLRRHAWNLKLALALDQHPTTSPEAAQLREQLRAGLEAVDTLDTSPVATHSTTATQEQWEALIFDEARMTRANVADHVFARIQQQLFSRYFQKHRPDIPRLIAAPPAFRGHFAEYALDGDSATFYWSLSPWRPPDTFAVDFGTSFPAGSQIEIELDDGNSSTPLLQYGVVEVSPNGIEWKTLGAVKESRGAWPVQVPFRCMRLVAKEENRRQLVIHEITVRRPNE